MHTHEYHLTKKNEKKTLTVIIITLLTMFFEITYGYLTNSMGLLADGYHMMTHVLALSLTYIAYLLIRKFLNSPLFPNGTEKIGTLTAYTSSLFLGLTGLWIIFESVIRFIQPLKIEFNEAILVAVIGLIVNIICIFIMHDKHHLHKKDHNFMAAYYHILADVVTSVLAIIALIIGKSCNFTQLDSFIGILGGILILKWAYTLICSTTKILVDMKEN